MPAVTSDRPPRPSGPISRPRRAPGSPHATTVLLAELLPGSIAYCDTLGDGPPILVIDFGYTELQISIPGDVSYPDQLKFLNDLAETIYQFRRRLVAHLDM